MTERPLDVDDDLMFARQLLDAGRAEPVPSARTAAAFATFAAGMATLGGHALGTGLAPSGGAGAGAAAWAGRWVVAKWLALGALMGGAATFVWLSHAEPVSGQAPSAVAAGPSAAAAVAPMAVADASAAVTSAPPAAAQGDEPERRVVAAEHQPTKARSGSIRPGAASSSSLAAEVAALDAVRTALAIGAWRDAELQLARYRREFAQGALRNEAEVLQITSLVGQGKKQAAASAAKAFLANHPRDPQAASVRALVE